MIEILREEGESRYSIELSKHHVMRFFKQQNGGTYWKTPLLYRSAIISQRVWHGRERWKIWWSRIRRWCVFLTNIVFDTTGCPIRLNHLTPTPLHTHKPEGIDNVKCPWDLSGQFPFKSMFMGVITWQLPELSFDRRILLKRISENFWKRTSYIQHFSDDAILNDGIMANIGGWS